MTEQQLKTRWIDIKKTFKARPLLVYIVGIPFEKWYEYMRIIPPVEEVNRVYDAIRSDRTLKTARIKAELQNIVGYRESKMYAKKTGVSDTTIRDIIEGKKITAGYDVIDRLEVFVSAVDPEFELSVENTLSKERLIKDEFEELINEIRQVSNALMRDAFDLSDVGRNMRENINYRGEIIPPSHGLSYSIERLVKVKESVDVLYELYIQRGG